MKQMELERTTWASSTPAEANRVVSTWRRFKSNPLYVVLLVWALLFLVAAAINVGAQPPTSADGAANAEEKKSANEKIKINPITDSAAVNGIGYTPLTKHERWQLYLSQNYASAGAYLGVSAGALIDQAGNQPPEWGGGLKGYGRRLASRYASNAIQGSIQSLGDAAMGLEPRYVRSKSHNPMSRVGHALLFSVMTINNEGKLRFNLPNVGSYYASSMIATKWMPSRYTALGDGVRDGNRQIVTGAAFNLVQEFWPEITKVLHRH